MISYNFPLVVGHDFFVIKKSIIDANLDNYDSCALSGKTIKVSINHGVFSNTTHNEIKAIINSYDPQQVAIDEAIVKKCCEITDYRDSIFWGPFTYDGSIFDGDKKSQRDIMEAIETNNTIERMRTIDPDFPAFNTDWILKDNTIRPLLSVDVDEINLLLMNKKKDSYSVCFWHKSIVFSLTTVSEIENYDFSASWPT